MTKSREPTISRAGMNHIPYLFSFWGVTIKLVFLFFYYLTKDMRFIICRHNTRSEELQRSFCLNRLIDIIYEI